MNAFRTGDESDIRRCRDIASTVFGAGWEKKGSGIYDEGTKDAEVWGIGHCHIG
jgi:alpha-mannosidase